MAQPQLPVPNPANIQAALNGMTAEENTIAQSTQAYNAHRRHLADELTLCANYPIGQVQQAVGQVQQAVGQLQQAVGQVQQAVGQLQQTAGQTQQAIGQLQQNAGQTQQAIGQMQQQLADLQRTLQRSTDKISAQIWNSEARIQNGKVLIATVALIVMHSIDSGPNAQVPIGDPIPNFPATPDQISRMTGTLPFQGISF
ncbi:uncharacterized protein Z518_03476 [Rhinocladiella mackenziei CBS 650.93]|uniref:Uncharacterized protein n=1 Tax=Rhinocladiella mackenziei CBS 650.93 TaxID=1442369 RepID=A0A0D2IS36_9EURO|nr:uncharacterized protein Z518_03476 [Rhinocladiella mackenziei CBS 650.93]KIX08819.1 hypothetical protein Z518_03476 [Rhinocladiella mackenziei CBS 650.93]